MIPTRSCAVLSAALGATYCEASMPGALAAGAPLLAESHAGFVACRTTSAKCWLSAPLGLLFCAEPLLKPSLPESIAVLEIEDFFAPALVMILPTPEAHLPAKDDDDVFSLVFALTLAGVIRKEPAALREILDDSWPVVVPLAVLVSASHPGNCFCRSFHPEWLA